MVLGYLYRSRGWWWPLLVAGLAFAGLAVVVANAGAFGDEGGAGVVFGAYLLFGAWGIITAVLGVLIGKAAS